jgi:hypothetical protein
LCKVYTATGNYGLFMNRLNDNDETRRLNLEQA